MPPAAFKHGRSASGAITRRDLLTEVLSDRDSQKAKRVMEAMLKMKEMEFAELKRATTMDSTLVWLWTQLPACTDELKMV